jgi:DNA (cytosine-5)-methyltransferase 1
MILLDLFSGIGGFHKGLENAWFEFSHILFSEIDKHAIANYKYNFKEAIYVGSIINISGTELREKYPREQFVITGGWPCQDNSIAGKRKGQVDGTRSNLLNEVIRLIREIQPEYFVFENVKGLYSVNDGKDFRYSLELLSYLDTDDFQ